MIIKFKLHVVIIIVNECSVCMFGIHKGGFLSEGELNERGVNWEMLWKLWKGVEMLTIMVLLVKVLLTLSGLTGIWGGSSSTMRDITNLTLFPAFRNILATSSLPLPPRLTSLICKMLSPLFSRPSFYNAIFKKIEQILTKINRHISINPIQGHVNCIYILEQTNICENIAPNS